MSRPLGLFQRLMLPFYSQDKIARILASRSPAEAAFILRGFPSTKSLAIISHWSLAVQVMVISELGDYGVKLIALLDLEQQSQFLVKLPAKSVRKLVMGIPAENLNKMIGIWSEEERFKVFEKIPDSVAAKAIGELPLDQRVSLLRRFKPWKAAPMMEGLDAEGRAEVLDGMDPKATLDLFDRWTASMKSEVLRLLNRERQELIITSLGSRSLVAILEQWDDAEVLELLVLIPEKRQREILRKLPQDYTEKIFPQLPVTQQRAILNTSEPSFAAELLGTLTKEEKEETLGKLHPDQASLIRKLWLMG